MACCQKGPKISQDPLDLFANKNAGRPLYLSLFGAAQDVDGRAVVVDDALPTDLDHRCVRQGSPSSPSREAMGP